MPSSHVIIRGHAFPYAEKSPYVPSGQSLLGALEYDEATDRVKCHECGESFTGLYRHIRVHGLGRKEYARKHGLRTKSALCGRATSEKHRVSAIRHDSVAKLRQTKRSSPKGKGSCPRSVESHNERAKCAAQLLFRIQVIAAQQGRTPTDSDLREVGIGRGTIVERFGSVERAMKILGLEPNRGPSPSPLPKAFTVKTASEWETEMPWPDDYFGVRPLERKRA